MLIHVDDLKILAIDPSYSGVVGWCKLIGTHVESGTIPAKAVFTDHEVADDLLRWAQVLVVETQFLWKNLHAYEKLVEARSAWEIPAKNRFALPVIKANPRTWMMAITGYKVQKKRDVSRQAIKHYVKRRYPELSCFTLTVHEEDAICIATWFQDAERIERKMVEIGA